MEREFDHIGIITNDKKENETCVEKTRVWVTDYAHHPYRVEWLRYEPDSQVKGPVREKPHVAFRTSNLESASKGLKVLLEPFDVGFAIVGFYESDDGAVIEFVKYKKEVK